MWLVAVFVVAAQQSPSVRVIEAMELPLAPIIEPEEAPTPTPAPVVVAPVPAAPVVPAAAGDAPLTASIGAAIDLPAATLYAMPSTRVDLLYALPLPVGLEAGVGVRTGYTYRAGKGDLVDEALGVDPAAYLTAHGIPVLGVASVSYGSGRESAVFVLPLRVGIYGGLGGQLFFGEAHAFGSTQALNAFAPTAVVGGALEIEQTPALRYVLFSEWESVLLRDLPGGDRDLSALRVGLSLAFSFGI
ncbi:MAG: hypothetical protein Q8O67_07405 [Deltaproteobacteria bacterium]|nr:hypothetical protein [Deltaproteobacteria bacterium]